GTNANTKNGAANTHANTSIAASGQRQFPCEESTSRVPTNGAVHVNAVIVKTPPITKGPAAPRPRPIDAIHVVTRVGSRRVVAPNNDIAKKMKIAAIARLTAGCAENRASPDAPNNTAVAPPRMVNAPTIPAA